MNKKNIVVIGGGFSGLKLLKLLKSLNLPDSKITLISDTQFFVFLPLVPDYITGRIKTLSDFTTSIPDFCRQLDVTFIAGKCVKLDGKNKEVFLKDKRKVRYDKCVICTGKTGSSNHKRYWSLLNRLKEQHIAYNTEKMGLAEFEIMSALYEAGKDVTVSAFGRHKNLNNHRLRKIMILNGQEERFEDINEFIQLNSIKGFIDIGEIRQIALQEHTEDVLVIGAAMNESDGNEPSAQRSSQNAHVVAYCMCQDHRERRNLKQEVGRRLKQYKSRGKMIFVKSRYALVWLGTKNHQKATLSGPSASMLRYLFYRFEFWLYYQKEGAPRLLCRLINWIRMHRSVDQVNSQNARIEQ